MPPIVQSVIVDITAEVDNATFNAAKLKIDDLDRSIVKLQQDQAKLTQDSAKYKVLGAEIQDLTTKKEKLNEALKTGSRAQVESAGSLGRFSGAAGLAKGALGALAAALATVEFGKFISNSINAAAALDKAAAAFRIFGLRADEARVLTEKLDGLSATTPFSSQELQDAAKELLKFNVSAKDVNGTITQLSTLSAGSGVSLVKLSQAFGRAQQTGRVFAYDFLQVYKNIPGLAESVAKSTGKTVDEVVKLGRSGKLQFADFAKGLKDVTSETGKYGQALKEYQNSFAGVNKELQESIGDLGETTGKQILPELAKAYQSLIPIFKDLIPLFEFIGRLTGGLIRGISELASIIVAPLAKLTSGIAQAFNNASRLTDEQIRESFRGGVKNLGDLSTGQRDALRRVLIDQYTDLYSDAAQNHKAGIAELTDEQKKALEERRKALERLLDSQEDFAKRLRDALFGVSQAELQREGLDEFAKANQIIKETSDRIADFKNRLKELEVQYKSLGLTIPRSIIDIYSETINALSDEANTKLESIFNRNIEISQPIEVLLPSNFIQFDETKIKREFSAKIQKLLDDIVKENIDFQAQNRVDKQANAKAGLSILGRILGIDPTSGTASEDLEKYGEIFKQQLSVFSSQAISAADTFISSELAKTDFLVSETEKRLNQLLSVQEGGNAEQIALEQKRLNALTEQRLKFQERQKAIDAAQILAANAVSAAESIKAITSAFGKSGGNPIVGIAASIALAATIAATIAALNSSFGQIPAFWEGAERVSDKLKPSRAGRDGYLTRVDGGERIVPTDLNKRIPSFVKNKDLPGLVELGLVASGGGMNDKNITRKQDETNKLLRQQSKLLRNQSIRLELVGDNSEKLRLQRMRK